MIFKVDKIFPIQLS